MFNFLIFTWLALLLVPVRLRTHWIGNPWDLQEVWASANPGTGVMVFGWTLFRLQAQVSQKEQAPCHMQQHHSVIDD